MPDPLRTSLTEQLERMRGGGSLPAPLTDIVSETLSPGGEQLTLIRPRDWDELRHEEGAAGRSAPYWAQLWPSGEALADALAVIDLAGARVIELGCGLGLPSLVAARRGAQVLATDASPDAVAFAAHNLAINELEGEAAQVDWREADPLLEGAPWDLVLAADVLYLRHNVEALLRLLPRLGGDVLLTDPSRAGARDFLAAARHMYRLESRPDPQRETVAVHRLTLL